MKARARSREAFVERVERGSDQLGVEPEPATQLGHREQDRRAKERSLDAGIVSSRLARGVRKRIGKERGWVYGESGRDALEATECEAGVSVSAFEPVDRVPALADHPPELALGEPAAEPEAAEPFAVKRHG